MTKCRLPFAFPSIDGRHLIIINRVLVPLLASLTTLFILLPGISGPNVGFYWLRVDYGNTTSAPDIHSLSARGGPAGTNGSEESQSPGSGVWDLGSFGACQQLGWGGMSTCEVGTHNPTHWNQVRDALAFHLAAAGIFFIIACLSSILFHFPESSTTRRWGTLIPILDVIWPTIVMISDLGVAHSIENKDDVADAERIGVYWLGTASFILSISWCISVQLEGARKRLQAGDEKPIIEDDEEESDGWADKADKAIWKAWPWNREKDRSRVERSRASRRSQKRKEKNGERSRGDDKQRSGGKEKTKERGRVHRSMSV
ncbi:hypothetical protein IAT40_007982 [Kwoniella sp. CBS 6097]